MIFNRHQHLVEFMFHAFYEDNTSLNHCPVVPLYHSDSRVWKKVESQRTLPTTSSHSVLMEPLRRFPFMPGTTSHRRLNTARSQQRRQRKSGAGEGRLSGCIHQNSSDGSPEWPVGMGIFVNVLFRSSIGFTEGWTRRVFTIDFTSINLNM